MQLIICEKPSVGAAIAAALGISKRENGYIEGTDHIVSWCIGHLVELAQPESYCGAWKKWTYESLPMVPEKWQYEVKPDTAAQYEVLKRLMYDARVESVVCATDAGREGELIFRLVYEMAGCGKPIERLWISSMEESAIREGFENLRSGSDYDNLYQSALCRQQADWLVGLNGTRLFTVLYGKVLKVGRVQTPTLAMLVDRESKIMNFKKEQYFTAHILMDGMDAATERIDDKAQAESIAAACESKSATAVSVTKEKKTIQPPKLYDLTTLQRDANRLFGFTAKQTLEYTQSLYEKKLVTYPRTDSQFLSDDMEQTAGEVIRAVFGSVLFAGNRIFNPDMKRIMNSNKVTDHHAIIPTVEIAHNDLKELPQGEYKILSLIANRFLCATGNKHLYETVKAEFSCGAYQFFVSGKSVMYNGWKEFEDIFRHSFKTVEDSQKDAAEEKRLPELSEGQVFDGVQTKICEHFTSAPKRFTEDSLLSAMERAGSEDMGDDVERKGLGTPATRADIIEKLVKDGYVTRDKRQMIPTEDGMKLITVLPDVVKSPKLTADWENALTLVSRGELAAEEFMGGIAHMVSELIHTYHAVSDEQKKMFEKEREILGKCPNCGGQIVKGKFGAYCEKKCGMNVSRVMGIPLTDTQIRDILAGKRILLKGLKGKLDKPYDAYMTPNGTEEYHYTKEGEEKRGIRFKFIMEFPKKKASGGKGKK